MPNFDTPQPITAVVEIAAGSIRLVASDRDDTVAEVRPRDESRPHDVKAAEQARVDFTNGTLAVTSKRGFAVSAQGSGDRRYLAAGRLPPGCVGIVGARPRGRAVLRMQAGVGQR